MNKENITKGEWVNKGACIVYETVDKKEYHIGYVMSTPNEPQRSKANAQLIAESGTVFNECGLTPRELLEQRNELLRALVKIQDHTTKEGLATGWLWSICQEVINKHKEVIK